MKRSARKGVGSILTGGMTVFVCLILAALWLAQTVFLDDFYLLIKKREIKSVAKTVSTLCPYGLTAENAETLGQKHGVCFIVYEMDEKSAKTIVSADALPRCAIHNTDEKSRLSLYGKAKENGGVYLQYFRFDPEKRAYTGVSDPKSGNTDEELSLIYAVADGNYFMIFNSAVTPVSSVVTTLYVLLSVFTAVIIVFSIILTRYFSRRITGPIERLTEAADRFGKGQLDTEFRVGGYAEAEKLSEALMLASEEINSAELLRRDFIANISHDLRTPITLITGYSEMMRDIPGENTPENLSNIVSEANRLSALVNDVLDYSKLVSGTVRPEMRDFCLTEELRKITGNYSEMLKKDGFSLSFFAEGDVYVHGDPAQIGRALINFISNAASHAGEDKRIEVAQKINGGYVTVSVTDHGPGIPEDKLADIWERYYKIGRNENRPAGGSGLGLSIVKLIIELHDGAYGVKSAVGKGSEFWFSLAIAEKPQNQQENRNL